MKLWKVLVIVAVVAGLNIYPIAELTRIILVQRGNPQWASMYIFPFRFSMVWAFTLELWAMWFGYLVALGVVGVLLWKIKRLCQ